MQFAVRMAYSRANPQLALHIAEIDRPDDTAALLLLKPDRIGEMSFDIPIVQDANCKPGHGTYLQYDGDAHQATAPIEVDVLMPPCTHTKHSRRSA